MGSLHVILVPTGGVRWGYDREGSVGPLRTIYVRRLMIAVTSRGGDIQAYVGEFR